MRMHLFGFLFSQNAFAQTDTICLHECSVYSVRNRTTPLSRSNSQSATFRVRPRPDTSGNSFSEIMPLLYSHAPPKTAKNLLFNHIHHDRIGKHPLLDDLREHRCRAHPRRARDAVCRLAFADG
jgi:hypothetical protein